MDVLSTVLFAKPSFNVEDVIAILEPTYTPIEDLGNPLVLEKQQSFFEDIAPVVLREKAVEDTNFCGKFVEFSTGSCYLPDRVARPEFRIKIEFDIFQTTDHLMNAHTCVNVLRVPGYPYTKDEFARKLEYAMNEVSAAFTDT